MTASAPLSLFAVTPPGIEAITAAELAELGIAGVVETGGVAWLGAIEQLHAANLRLRTASRILVRVAEFRARTFFELERHAGKVPWERFLAPGRAVRLRVTSRKSRLYHQRAVAERVLAAIEGRVGALGPTETAGGDGDDEEDASAAQLFVVRFLHDRCVVSADASGAHLHLRGYRRDVAKAPLRESVAAAMLLAGGWRGQAPLLDPMCGSGTIAIEAALLARRIPPGLALAERTPRRPACLEWPEVDPAGWAELVARARAEILPAAGVPIAGSDRDAGAIAAARGNAERAGVLADLELEVRAVSALAVPKGAVGTAGAAAGAATPGWLVTNPPWGLRVGERDGLRDLYAALGRAAREGLPGWTVALLSADRRLEAQLRIPLAEVLHTRSGGIPVRLVVGTVSGRPGR